MSSLAIMRGSRNEINNAPIVDGQIFMETDQTGVEYNKIYIDNDTERLNLGIDNWNNIINKPFETVGDTLSTAENKLSIHTEWDRITNKPFEIIGDGINISNNKLNTNVQNFICDWERDTDYAYQYLNINDITSYIYGSQYIEQEKELSTTDDNVFIFNSFDDFQFNKNTEVEIYSSIWNYFPKSIRIKRNKTCVVTFPPYPSSHVSLTCRVYLKEV